jgi:hypothetical protein
MQPVAPIPIGELSDPPGGFVGDLRPDDLVYFLLNVGDGDSQVVLLPEEEATDGSHHRRVIVVDAATVNKVPRLLGKLEDEGLMGDGHSSFHDPGSIALVVATHPHSDHIGGIPQLLESFKPGIAEFWDPGYFHTIGDYHRMMAEIESAPFMVYANPTSGLRRWFGRVAITVLSPSIQLRNRFDSYGIEINNSSISLKIDYPASRVQQRDEERNYLGSRRAVQSLILGGDAQTVSWSFVLTDFPYLAASGSAAARALRMATGADPLRARILKVSHHASKRGVNLELIERVKPLMMLASCVNGGGSYNFPHTVTQEVLREAVEPIAKTQAPRSDDWQLKLFYTCDEDDAGEPLGSIAIVLGRGHRRRVWRFGDTSNGPVDLNKARLMTSAGA